MLSRMRIYTRIVAAVVLCGITWRGPVEAQGPAPIERIIGGSDASAGEAPWMASLHTFGYQPSAADGGHFCGGVLIHPSYVLTAAHCVLGRVASPATLAVTVNRRQLSVQTGTTAQVESVNLHPNYNDITLEYDLALLKLKAPISGVQPARIVPPGTSANAATVGTVYGWGVTSADIAIAGDYADILQVAAIPIPTESQCVAVMLNYFIPSSMLCAGKRASSAGALDGIDSCMGDSGDPLLAVTASGVTRIVAISSWGYDVGCANHRYYGVYSRVDVASSWIYSLVPITPAAISNPAVNGSATVGQTLQCVNTTWEGSNLSFSYTWENSNGQQVAQGPSSYQVRSADIGLRLRCIITAQNQAGAASVSSALSAVVAGAPTTTTTTTSSTSTTSTTSTSSSTTSTTMSGGTGDTRVPRISRLMVTCTGTSCSVEVAAADRGRVVSGVRDITAVAALKVRQCGEENGRRRCSYVESPIQLTAVPDSDPAVARYTFNAASEGTVIIYAQTSDNAGNQSRQRRRSKRVRLAQG